MVVGAVEEAGSATGSSWGSVVGAAVVGPAGGGSVDEVEGAAVGGGGAA